MSPNRVAENVLGTIGTVCWTIQLIPQVWKSYHTKSTEGLSPFLVLLWAISAGFLGVYAIVQDLNIPLIIQPQLFGSLSLVSWGQCLYYDKKLPRRTCIAITALVATTIGALEAGMVFAVKPAYRHGNERPVQFFGIFSSVLIGLALIPQYYEIWKHGEVIGISIMFMLIDLLGGVFSDLSLAFRDTFDPIAAATYSVVVVMDALVIIAALILNPLASRRRKRAAHHAAEAQVVANASSSRLAVEGALQPTIREGDMSQAERGEVIQKEREEGESSSPIEVAST